jgi:Uma2 family endonuclease
MSRFSRGRIERGTLWRTCPPSWFEIKSPDDTFDDIVDKCFEYEKLGVGNTLVMDPDNKRAWRFQHGNLKLLSGFPSR